MKRIKHEIGPNGVPRVKEVIDMKKVGRPPVMSDKVVKKLVEILKMGGTVGDACAYAQIDRGTYYNHYNNDPSFSTEMDSAKIFTDVTAMRTVSAAVQEGSKEDAWKWLEKRRSDIFGTKPQSQVNIAGNEVSIEFIRG